MVKGKQGKSNVNGGKVWSRNSLSRAKGGSPMDGVRQASTGRGKLRPTNGMSNLGKASGGGAPVKGNKGPVKG